MIDGWDHFDVHDFGEMCHFDVHDSGETLSGSKDLDFCWLVCHLSSLLLFLFFFSLIFPSEYIDDFCH